MRKITKGYEPTSFSKWRRDKSNKQTPNSRFEQLFNDKRWDIVNDLSQSCVKEQYYLCCYCCCRISGDYSDTRNEHVEARKIAPVRALEYENITGSCTTTGQCDNAHGSQPLPLTPFMDECETELKFYISGRVTGLTPDAVETIRVLNLGDNEANNKKLIMRRKAAIEALLGQAGYTSDDWKLEEDEILEMMLEDLDTPVNGKLEPYAPVLKQILRVHLG